MDLTLSEQQRAAIEQHPGEPLTINDDRTRTQYVLVRADLFRRLQQLAYDDSDWTPEEMIAAAGAAASDLDDCDVIFGV